MTFDVQIERDFKLVYVNGIEQAFTAGRKANDGIFKHCLTFLATRSGN